MNGSSKENYPRAGMTHEEFQKASKEMAEYISQYYKSLAQLKPRPDVEPGYLKKLLPSNAPETPESWEQLKCDLDNVVMKGMTHWQSSGFFAFYPCSASYPSVLAETLISAASCIGFTWMSSPSCTELEIITTNWLAKALHLPETFLHKENGRGGGVIQGTASEATLMMLLSARTKYIRNAMESKKCVSQYDVLPKLVAYTSDISHSSVERACLIAMIRIRKLPVNNEGAVEGKSLSNAIKEDKSNSLIPMFMCATLGTTPCCSFDKLEEIGKVCKNENVWLHVDAAYAGSSFICEEYRKHMSGVELADSFNFNPHKWLMVNFDCSVLWMKNCIDIVNSLNVNPLYLQHEQQSSAIDYRHWQIPLGRRFRSLKLWFVLRLVGLDGLRHKIREDTSLAILFKRKVEKDDRFEIVFPVYLGLVCFRLIKDKGDLEKNRQLNELLLQKVNAEGSVYIVPAQVNEIYFLRVSVGSMACSEESVTNCWKVIQKETFDLV